MTPEQRERWRKRAYLARVEAADLLDAGRWPTRHTHFAAVVLAKEKEQLADDILAVLAELDQVQGKKMSSLDGTEKVCVVGRNFLTNTGTSPINTGFCPVPPDGNGLSFMRALAHGAEFRPRTGELEADLSWKQLIPYGVLVRESEHTRAAGSAGKLIWGYRRPRKVGDVRLRGLISIGVGGHLRDTDRCPPDPGEVGDQDWLYTAVVYGLLREVSEEIALDCAAFGQAVLGYDPSRVRLVGVVNDESTPVGRVHLGLVFAVSCDPGWEPKASDEVEPLGWNTAAGWAAATGLERWSEEILGAALRNPGTVTG